MSARGFRQSYLTVVICQVLAAIAAIAALRWLALYVTPQTFGRFTLYQSLVSAGALFLVSWPNAALLRFGREEWTTHGRIGLTFGARLALFAVSASAALALSWVFDSAIREFLDVDRSPFLWLAAGLIVIPAAELSIYLHQAIGRPQVYGYSPLITRVGFLVGVVMVPLFGDPEWTYLAGCLIASTSAATVFAFATLPPGALSGLGLSSPVLSTLVRTSWTLPFAGLSVYVVNWVDSLVIREVKGVSSVGVYNWAYQITSLAGLAFAPIAVALTPRVIDARVRNDSARIQRYVDSILPAAVVLAAAMGVAFIGVFPAMGWLTTPAYLPAYPVVLILLSALPAQLISYLVTPLANAYERLLPRIVVVSACIAAMNAVGDLLLVPPLGIMGAAIATTTAFTIGSLMLVVVIGSVGIRFAPLWRYLIPTLLLGPAVALLHWTGPGTGSLLIGAAATAGVLTIALRHRRRASAGAAPLARAVELTNALTLSD